MKKFFIALIQVTLSSLGLCYAMEQNLNIALIKTKKWYVTTQTARFGGLKNLHYYINGAYADKLEKIIKQKHTSEAQEILKQMQTTFSQEANIGQSAQSILIQREDNNLYVNGFSNLHGYVLNAKGSLNNIYKPEKESFIITRPKNTYPDNTYYQIQSNDIYLLFLKADADINYIQESLNQLLDSPKYDEGFLQTISNLAGAEAILTLAENPQELLQNAYEKRERKKLKQEENFSNDLPDEVVATIVPNFQNIGLDYVNLFQQILLQATGKQGNGIEPLDLIQRLRVFGIVIPQHWNNLNFEELKVFMNNINTDPRDNQSRVLLNLNLLNPLDYATEEKKQQLFQQLASPFQQNYENFGLWVYNIIYDENNRQQNLIFFIPQQIINLANTQKQLENQIQQQQNSSWYKHRFGSLKTWINYNPLKTIGATTAILLGLGYILYNFKK